MRNVCVWGEGRGGADYVAMKEKTINNGRKGGVGEREAQGRGGGLPHWLQQRHLMWYVFAPNLHPSSLFTVPPHFTHCSVAPVRTKRIRITATQHTRTESHV